MRSVIRESYDIDEKRRYFIYYTPGEYFYISVIKFLFFLFVVWPIQIVIYVLFLPFIVFFKKGMAMKVLGLVLLLVYVVLGIYTFK